MLNEYYDMDQQTPIRYVSESSNASTSGYSTMSPASGTGSQTIGNGSPSSHFSMSPAPSPATAALQNEFSNLNLPGNSPLHQQHNSPYYQLQTTTSGVPANGNLYTGGYQYFNTNTQYTNSAVTGVVTNIGGVGLTHTNMFMTNMDGINQMSTTQKVKTEYPAVLEIVEQPVDKFRFRYKSEMHGTHGSLNGANSKRTPKTFPEVELKNYKYPAVIRCSLFQTNLDSPHSHQLVVRKDDRDVCDPHDLHVSEERGYVAQFMNMGIIHTAKKFIFDELFKKKQDRLVFQMGRRELSTKQTQELHKETEKEAKDMNLNQVRLCFEAFKIEDNNVWTPIAAPVFTNPINNRKSAQTGELRIVRLSIAAGSVMGNDELILLVEKVSKKNIKVRFFEQNEDDETVWEEYAKFRESDVHHQYAIVCQTPAYKNKDIEKQVEVFIELIRPSDDERSYPALPFRYKPRESVVSRKRRRTCSTATSSSGTGSANSSIELPKPVEEQGNAFNQTISEEFGRDAALKTFYASNDFPDFEKTIGCNSAELIKMCTPFLESNLMDALATDGVHERDGASTASISSEIKRQHLQKLPVNDTNSYLQRIFKINDELRYGKGKPEPAALATASKQINELFLEHADKNRNGDTLIHEVISQKTDNIKLAIKTFQILNSFQLQEFVNLPLNNYNQSGLHIACLHDRPHYIRPLLSMGCNPNIQDLQTNNTALHIAVKEEHIKCVESFLKATNVQLDLKLKNDQGLTALHIALRQNNYDVAKQIIKFDRTAIDVCNKDGNNALHLAVLQQNVDLIVLILDAHNVDDILTMRNTGNYTPLELAKQLDTKTSKAIVQLLEPCYKHLPLDLVKVKEEVESSSTEDDEESNEAMDTNDQTLSIDLIKTEQLEIDGDDGGGSSSSSSNELLHNIKVTRNLEDLLNDTRKFNALVLLLDQKNGNVAKWQQLVEKSKMQHLSFLWDNAEAMLNYVKTKSSNIEYSSFARALAEVDLAALQVLQRS